MRLPTTLSKRFDALYPRPVEVRLIEILGGVTLTVGMFRRNGRPMVITLSRGRLLRSRRFRRKMIDEHGVLANDLRWCIRIMGPEYERRVVEMYEQDEYLKEHGWRLGYIRAWDVWNNPDRVRQILIPFVSA